MRIATQITAVALVMASVSGAWASATVESSATGVAARIAGRSARVAVGANLEVGTRIVVSRAGRGETVLRYDDGCEVRLRPGQAYTIAEIAPCGVAAPAEPPPLPAPAAGLAGGIAPAVVGGVVVAAAVAGVVAATSGKKSSTPYIPLSP